MSADWETAIDEAEEDKLKFEEFVKNNKATIDEEFAISSFVTIDGDKFRNAAPLLYCISQTNLYALKTIAAGAKITPKILQYATLSYDKDSDDTVHEDMLAALLPYAKDVINRPLEGYTQQQFALRLASHWVRLKQMHVLLAGGADPNIRTKEDGSTPLISKCDRIVDGEHLKAFQILLGAKGIDVNRQDNNGQTALHHSLKNQFHTKEQVVLLLESGARIDLPDIYGVTTLGSSARGGYTPYVRLYPENIVANKDCFPTQYEYVSGSLKPWLLLGNIIKKLSEDIVSQHLEFYKENFEKLYSTYEGDAAADDLPTLEEIIGEETGRINGFVPVLQAFAGEIAQIKPDEGSSAHNLVILDKWYETVLPFLTSTRSELERIVDNINRWRWLDTLSLYVLKIDRIIKRATQDRDHWPCSKETAEAWYQSDFCDQVNKNWTSEAMKLKLTSEDDDDDDDDLIKSIVESVTRLQEAIKDYLPEYGDSGQWVTLKQEMSATEKTIKKLLDESDLIVLPQLNTLLCRTYLRFPNPDVRSTSVKIKAPSALDKFIDKARSRTDFTTPEQLPGSFTPTKPGAVANLKLLLKEYETYVDSFEPEFKKIVQLIIECGEINDEGTAQFVDTVNKLIANEMKAFPGEVKTTIAYLEAKKASHSEEMDSITQLTSKLETMACLGNVDKLTLVDANDVNNALSTYKWIDGMKDTLQAAEKAKKKEAKPKKN